MAHLQNTLGISENGLTIVRKHQKHISPKALPGGGAGVPPRALFLVTVKDYRRIDFVNILGVTRPQKAVDREFV